MSKVWFIIGLHHKRKPWALYIEFHRFHVVHFSRRLGAYLSPHGENNLWQTQQLMYHCVNSFKVLFSHQVSWVIIMASQVYYGFMLFNMIAL